MPFETLEELAKYFDISKLNIYVDSDGVLSNFLGWCQIYDETITNADHEKIYKVMAEHYDTCFRTCGQLPDTDYYFEHLREMDSNWKVLTNLTPWNKLAPYAPEGVTEQEMMDTMIRNKIEWFAERGVHFSKVQINIGDKSVYADEKSVLIDDYHKNCEQWEQKNGQSVLVK